MNSLWGKGYSLYVTAKIKFSVEEPIIGGQFLRNCEQEPYFLKDNKIGYARCLFPCLDSIEDYYKISKFRVSINRPEYEIFGYGKGSIVSKSEKLKVIDFDINKVVHPSYICLIVGPFHKVSIPKDKIEINQPILQPKG